MPALTIYKASAGAGKTFRLVVEYIKLLIVRPDNYQHILAVTFTKKATQEMKMRILTQLYGIWKGLPSSEAYVETIAKELKDFRDSKLRDPKKLISQNAGKALHLILNDYSRFRIETIDSFFQSVLRNMTKELDINFNMRVELNGEQVKNKAIDQMIDNLEPKDVDFRRIVNFAEENMREGKTWNIIGGLKDFGKNVFTDFYQSHSKDYKERLAADPELFRKYKKTLAEQKLNEDAIRANRQQLELLIERCGLQTGIFARKGMLKYFENIDNGEFLKIPSIVKGYLEGSAEDWFNKKDKTEQNCAIVRDTLMPALRKVIALHEKEIEYMNTCRMSLQNLNNLELLASIENAIDKDNLAANRFLLSSTNHLLAGMISGSDAPFIFEKIGTQIEHLMIDEFQDTSTVQWNNFKTLLTECIDCFNPEENKGTIGSMIVGDVKQSIYRWRGGDWNLLNDIDKEFEGRESMIEVKNLDTNFRSESGVINFNNEYFEAARDIYGIDKAYDDVSQKVKPGRTPAGEVNVYMMTESAYKTRHKYICDKVKTLIDSGVRAKDIVILGRYSNILKEIARLFSIHYPEIHVVSKESFQLNSSDAVNIMVCALKLMNKPSDRILRARIEKDLKGIIPGVALMLDGVMEQAAKKSSFIDTMETIYRELHLDQLKEDGAFVSTFFDFVKDFSTKNTATTRNFLKLWEETLYEKTIESEATDGVQLMTIHKSKGLEFKTVVLADGYWENSLHRNNIWVETAEKPFNEIPFNLFKAVKGLGNTIYKGEFQTEYYQNMVDNLNLLYVAFTRAAERLIVFAQQSKDGKMEQCLNAIGKKDDSELNSEETEIDDFEAEDEAGYMLRFWPKGEENIDNVDNIENLDILEKVEVLENVFDLPITPVNIEIKSSKMGGTFRQSNHSKDFVNRTSANPYIETGLLMHNILAQIEAIEDEKSVGKILQQLEFEGIISDKTQTARLERCLQNTEAREWFAPRWTVYNECSILTKDGEKRPDRVITDEKETIVIDFKFGKQRDKYKEQVLQYKRLLEEIGLPNVKARLWYIGEESDEIVNVD